MTFLKTASDELIPMIYAATLGETGWQDFVQRLAELADVECTTLFSHDSRGGKGAVTLQSGIPEAAQQEYLSHYGALNPWMWQVGRTPIGTAIIGEQLVARDRFNRTEYYNDFLRRYDQETGVGVTIAREDGRFLLLSTLSGDVNVERNQARAALLTSLAPHLRRSADFYRRHRLEGLGADVAAHLGRTSGYGLVLLDTAGRAVFISPEAGPMLELGNVAKLGPYGMLHLRDSDARDALKQMLLGFGGLRPVTIRDAGYAITLMPVGQEAAARHFNGRTVAVVLAPDLPEAPSVARKFGLTPAEARVLAGILNGQRPRQIAETNGLSVETVRTQLKSVFSKTGVNGQADLVRLATGLAGPGHD